MKVLVIGSINTDFVITTNVMPQIGETVLGSDFEILSGGKGANQAVAAARLGAEVSMIAAVGDDEMGKREIKILKQENIDTTGVYIKNSVPTGVAVVNLFQNDNSIIVVGGANAALTIDDIRQQQAKIIATDVVLCSLEIPVECVLYACSQARKYGKHFILNPAPAQDLPDELLLNATLITPNQIEYAQLLKLQTNEDIQEHLLNNSNDNYLITCGKNGVLYKQNNKLQYQDAFNVSVVDTTGAGDTFNGALAAFFELPLEDAIYYATAAAALSVTHKGARNGMPFIEELKEFLN